MGIGPVRLHVRVQPRARQNAVLGWEGDILQVQLKAPPVRGKANEGLIALLADCLDVPKSAVTLLGGQTSRRKLVGIQGLDEAEVRRRLKTPENPKEVRPGLSGQ